MNEERGPIDDCLSVFYSATTILIHRCSKMGPQGYQGFRCNQCRRGFLANPTFQQHWTLNYGFERGELSTTQKEGIITCIPKGNKSKKYIKNWRPISLLNISYKIGSGCIANRIKKVLPSVIDLDQTGFMSDRFTGDNIRLIYDTLNFSNVQKQRGLLLLIDFEKAFDSVAWSFIEKTF